MINEFSAHPKPRNNNAKIFFALGMFISAALLILYFAVNKYKGVVGMFVIIALTVSILIYTKYVSVSFYYDITFDSNEVPIFVVRQITGKRQTTLCRVDLADIREVKYETSEERKAHKRDIDSKLYVYTPTIFPPDVYRITAKNAYDSFELIIECTEEFAGLLSAYSNEARDLSALGDEE